MTALTTRDHTDAVLTDAVIAHLDAQLIAARGLLQVVLDQGAAIRRRDVQNVVRLAGQLQAEMQRRMILDAERMRLLERAGARLDVTPAAVTLTLLETLMDPVSADAARSRSAELRGLLSELQREHHCNRVLMNQELLFLDHLMRLADGDGVAYDSGGDRRRANPLSAVRRPRAFDLEA
jgi:beta-lactamase class A